MTNEELEQLGATYAVLEEIRGERKRQDAKWGQQNHADGIKHPQAAEQAAMARLRCQWKTDKGLVTWADILNEEIAEAGEVIDDPVRLREELIQVAAVAAAWVEAIDRRAS